MLNGPFLNNITYIPMIFDNLNRSKLRMEIVWPYIKFKDFFI